MDKLPTPVQIKPEHHKKLLHLNNGLIAMQEMMQKFQETYQARVNQHIQETQQVWAQIAAETGIDVQNINWAPHNTDPVIHPISIRLAAK